jgi:hypothetical protein
MASRLLDDDDPVPVAVVPLLIVRVSNRTNPGDSEPSFRSFVVCYSASCSRPSTCIRNNGTL